MSRWILLLLVSTWSLQGSSLELRDPTAPPAFISGGSETGPAGSSEAGQSNLILTEILMSPEDHLAVINGQRVKAGDEIRDARVISVNYDSVELIRRGKTIELELLPVKVKSVVGEAGRLGK